jgi:hypothetical protein
MLDPHSLVSVLPSCRVYEQSGIHELTEHSQAAWQLLELTEANLSETAIRYLSLFREIDPAILVDLVRAHRSEYMYLKKRGCAGAS